MAKPSDLMLGVVVDDGGVVTDTLGLKPALVSALSGGEPCVPKRNSLPAVRGASSSSNSERREEQGISQQVIADLLTF